MKCRCSIYVTKFGPESGLEMGVVWLVQDIALKREVSVCESISNVLVG